MPTPPGTYASISLKSTVTLRSAATLPASSWETTPTGGDLRRGWATAPRHGTIISSSPPEPMTASIPSTAVLTLIGATIREVGNDPLTADNIRQMQQHPGGAEILRLIVRDDLGGAASIIADALWSDL